MSHDLYAAWASTEVSRIFKTNSDLCFESASVQAGYSVYSGRESRSKWPISDGVITIENQAGDVRPVAVEFKRVNEGLHGILTALGQSQAYIHKGFSGAVIIIPEKYESHSSPGNHLASVIDQINSSLQIAIFGYKEPDASKASPFDQKIQCVRPLKLVWNADQALNSNIVRRVETQWAHFREGSSEPDAFYLYLKTAKTLKNDANEIQASFPQGLIDACNTLAPDKSPEQYLSYSSGVSLHDKIWRSFWFSYVLTLDLSTIWQKNGRIYSVNHVLSKIKKSDNTGFKQFFSGRADSIKNKLIDDLNSNEINEVEAWIRFAENIHNRAHSYREDIDSSLDHLGFLYDDGRITDLGYKFVDACERTGDPNSGYPLALLGASILKNGQMGAWLHYIYRLSEQKLKTDPLMFTNQSPTGALKFDQNSYLSWIENELSQKLAVMRKVSLRGGAQRRPFQAELAILRSHKLVGGFRVGVGLEVNWPKVQELLEIAVK